MERRNRLRILQPWLEALVATGNTETATHNAIGKIYITLNRDPVAFLKNNQFYDPRGTDRPIDRPALPCLSREGEGRRV